MDMEPLNAAAEALAHAVNVMGSASQNAEVFLDALRNQHRTLQQGIIGLFIGTIKRYGKLPDNAIDSRNNAAREACKKLGPIIEEQFLDCLPLI